VDPAPKHISQLPSEQESKVGTVGKVVPELEQVSSPCNVSPGLKQMVEEDAHS